MIRLSKACVDREELKALEPVFLETVHFGLGKQVQQFEGDIQEFIGTDREVIALNTGTSALHAALLAFQFPKGSEVIVPSITFVASHSAISAAGLVPVSCDVLKPDCHLDPADVEKRLSPRTVAIMPVAYSGTDFDRAKIYSIAEKHNLRVIEDDAHAFGSLTKNTKKFGAEGDVVCFSFDGIKNITCGEGGAVVTADKDLAHRIRVIRALGIEKDVTLRYQGKRAWEYDVQTQGFRYHMSNINAAIGSVQIKKLPKFIEIKNMLVKKYMDGIASSELAKVLTPTQSNVSHSCLHVFSCLIPDGMSRETVQSAMREKGVETGFHYVPNHHHAMYKSSYELPVADEMGRRLLTLPLHPSLTVQDVETVLKVAKEVLLR